MNKPADPRFQLFFWRHRLLLLGPAFDTDCHAHHAAQLGVGLMAPVRVRRGQAAWQQASGFYVPPDVVHQFDGAGTPCVMLYLDPESVDCQRACQRWGEQGVRTLDNGPNIPESWKALILGGAEVSESLAEELVAYLLEPHEPEEADLNASQPRQVDPRLRHILVWLDSHLAEAVRLRDAAAAGGVSESWLSHQFSRTFGLPLRRYVLWRRLRRATELALAGLSLTEAAHAAGFSDSAHLTRTFRENFGVTPSFLVGHPDPPRVVFVDQ
ncbi:AraC family transcriptional regulator [Alcanivorax sp. JB21]|uniref:helix-turn-helix transcriptional regulator n=1 Tax=Alcanivorax limicola TaxID=2874102 RepID=UPI001CBD9BA0|nr:AraC family transcriptional regulator [Alcanivorax limicola]MBZ2190010.1 AraC family transcriptional regulator [Alcanivorax limicola]